MPDMSNAAVAVPRPSGGRTLTFVHSTTLWLLRLRTRRALSQLEPRLLADVGLSERSAAAEASKPFWRA